MAKRTQPPAESKAKLIVQNPQDHVTREGAPLGYLALERLVRYTATLLTKTACTTQKMHMVWKIVCRKSSTDFAKDTQEPRPSIQVPTKARRKVPKATPPRATAVETSTKDLPVRADSVALWMLRMESAEDCWMVTSSSFKRPTSPVALLPAAFWQNQHECSFTFAYPTSVKTRFMCSIFTIKVSMAVANVAISSRIARTSVIARPSTSNRRLTMLILPYAASVPRNSGFKGEPFNISSLNPMK
mmetsp:Transcript_61513/g.178353  ORF Transcript_61513/g.178353 Transcript_61513/m.178353 type:complete len:244 (+) Transcript_61513:1158-1889(+)